MTSDDLQRRRPGFSLVEVLIALMVLAAGIVVVMSTFTAATLGVQKARNGRIAADAGSSLIDQMRAAGINSLNYANFPADFQIPAPGNPSTQVGTGHLVITPVYEGQQMPVYFEITVTTRVTGTRGTSANAKLVTYIAPR